LGKPAAETVVDGTLYAAARGVLALLQTLPWALGRRAAGLLGDLAYVIEGYLHCRRREISLANLMRAFPALSRWEAEGLLRRSYRHFAEVLLDALNFARVAGHRPELVVPVGWERLAEVEPATGVIFATAHFGNWEVLGMACPLLGFPLWSVVREFDNVFVDRYVRRVRCATGQRLVCKHGGLRRIVRLLEQGKHAGFLIDQDAGREGIFVDFFGRPAKTFDSPARIAMRTSAPVAFIYARRTEGNRFECVLADLIPPDPAAEPAAEARRITQRLTADLEELVRLAPQEWSWRHRRWKTYPGKHGRDRNPA
jgi:KDO2-lipid IV(A) lauroyltransferase